MTVWRRRSCPALGLPTSMTSARRTPGSPCSRMTIARARVIERLGSARPPAGRRLQSRGSFPVSPDGGEDVDDGRALRSGVGGVADVALDRVALSHAQLPFLAVDDHRHPALEDEAELLVLVVVLG